MLAWLLPVVKEMSCISLSYFHIIHNYLAVFLFYLKKNLFSNNIDCQSHEKITQKAMFIHVYHVVVSGNK